MIIIKRQPASAHTHSEWTQKQHVAAPPLTVQLRTSELNAIRASWHNVKRERESDSQRFVGGAMASGKSRGFFKMEVPNQSGTASSRTPYTATANRW